ncbi:diacylglycerol kinase family protein [Nesterenkonia sp.]|uniref:diacylglycerol/lipid kinase family protein n=1 Tax=Nesterenkonia sp. TaxID=704201 RepID=UPI0026090BDA|nr:diacylglycerol kinase family protein [Nesterenkonia sp.]
MSISPPEQPAGRPIRRRVLVLLNPAAGQGWALERAQQHLDRRAGLQCELIVPDPSDQRAQMEAARSAVDRGLDAVVVYGGDGMVSAGVGLTAERGIPLGVVPVGTGNDFARAAGIPRGRSQQAVGRVLDALEQPSLPSRPVDALRLTVTQHPSTPAPHTAAPGAAAPGVPATDAESRAEQVSPRWVGNSVNIGFDARVNRRANQLSSVPGPLRYLSALAREVPQFRPTSFQLGIDAAAPVQLSCALVCVQNGTCIGGGIPLAPQARLDDGWAEVSHVAPLPRAGLIALFPLLMLRRHAWLRPLTTRRARQVRITVPAGVPVFADGDEMLSGESESPAEVTVELVPGAVRLLG